MYLTSSKPTKANCSLPCVIRQEFVVDQLWEQVRIGERGCRKELGKQLHIVRLTLGSVGEHEMCSRNGSMRPGRGDGCGQHLVNRGLLDSKHYVRWFEGLVNTCAGFDVVRSAERSSLAVLDEYIHIGGLDEVADSIRG